MTVENLWPDKTIFDVELASWDDFAAPLNEFDKHRKTLLDILSKVRGSESFDKDNSWCALRRAAYHYFQRPVKKEVLPARRAERLRELAKKLRRVRHVLGKAMQDDVGFDLFRGWCVETNTSHEGAHVHNRDGTVELNKITELASNLSTLEGAASRAARDVRTKRGPPRGRGILTLADVLALASVYQRSTGQKPIMGPGPFADFVEKFLIGVGRSADIAQDYVVEAFKYLRRELPRSK
jgi:hypothetical protein